jgi:hypothetical protein
MSFKYDIRTGIMTDLKIKYFVNLKIGFFNVSIAAEQNFSSPEDPDDTTTPRSQYRLVSLSNNYEGSGEVDGVFYDLAPVTPNSHYQVKLEPEGAFLQAFLKPTVNTY